MFRNVCFYRNNAIIIPTSTGYEQSHALFGSSATRISDHIPQVEKVKMAVECFAEDEIKSLLENKTQKKATKFGNLIVRSTFLLFSNDYLFRFLPKIYCLCRYMPVCLQSPCRLIINTFVIPTKLYFFQNPMNVDKIKQLFHPISLYILVVPTPSPYPVLPSPSPFPPRTSKNQVWFSGLTNLVPAVHLQLYQGQCEQLLMQTYMSH